MSGGELRRGDCEMNFLVWYLKLFFFGNFVGFISGAGGGDSLV